MFEDEDDELPLYDDDDDEEDDDYTDYKDYSYLDDE